MRALARDAPGTQVFIIKGGILKAKRITSAMICVLMSVLLSLVPLSVHVSPVLSTLENSTHINVDVQKNEAIANPAFVAAGAGLAALAAELGISEAALIAGICAIGVGATGLAVYNAQGIDTTLPPAPGFKPWDDLTPGEQEAWGSNDAGNTWPENYAKNAVGWWALKYGLLEIDENGDPQIPEEPDPEEDPNGNSKWNKARNVISALAVTGGAVALNEALGPLVDNAAQTIKDILFGNPADDGLGLVYTLTADIDGVTIPFTHAAPEGISVYNVSSWFLYQPSGSYKNYFNPYTTGETITFTLSQDGNTWTSQPFPTRIDGASQRSNGTWTTTFLGGNYIGFQFYNGSVYALNDSYCGQYVFDDYVFQNGAWSVSPALDMQYGQMQDTPSGLPQAIYNNNVNNFINNYTDPNVEGYTRALTVPDWMLDGSGSQSPEYSDFVIVSPDEEITPIPDDQPLPGPGPTPTPTPDEQYQEDFGQRVGQLLAQPFDQLFPFCLIGDLRRLCLMLGDAVYGESGELNAQSIEVINGTETFVIPLDGFGLDDIEIEFDLTPITVLAGITRPFMTALFITGILVGSFRFFLVRGGE